MTEEQPYPPQTSKFPELGFLGFKGSVSDTRSCLEEIQYAEQLGIGNVTVSERIDYREASALCGAVAAVTEKMHITTSATNANTRHPMILAGMCSTLSRLSLGRFALGLGKGSPDMWKNWGLEPVNFAREREYLDVLRRQLRGELIENYSGLIGDYPRLNLIGDHVQENVPMLFVGYGPKSLKNAGTLYDGVLMHTFMSPEAVSRAAGLVREGEQEAGRKSGSTKVWTMLATLCNISEERYLKDVVARLATYLQFPGYAEGLAKINGWDVEEIKRIRQHPAFTAVEGVIDIVATMKQLETIEKIIPQEWRSAAVGTPAECARRWVEEFEAGAHGITIHAASPVEFEPILAEYEKIRPAELFTGRTNSYA